MITTRKKFEFSLAILLTMFITVIFSIVIALSAQQVSLMGGININYKASGTATLISGLDFNDTIPEDCSSIIFDYASNYPSIPLDPNNLTTLDVENLGLNAGGISSYYDSTNTTFYVLSDYEIYANPDCTNMFMSKSNIISIDFHNFNTSNVTTMLGMFQICSSLKSLDLSNFNTSNVEDMGCMFLLCSSLTSLDLTSFNTSNVTNMGGMFHQCSKLISLDVSSFNTTNVKGMGYMFYSCPSLTSLDLSSFNTSKVTGMYYMFHDCRTLTTIWVSEAWSAAGVTASESMFYNCEKLVGGLGTVYNDSYQDFTYAKIDGGPSSPGYFTLSKSATLIVGKTFNSNIPEECTSIIFDYASNYQSIASSPQAIPVDVKGAGLNDGGISSYYDQSNKTLYVLSNHEIYANYDCSYIFANMLNIKNLDFSNFNTSNVENMEGMFGASQIPGSLDLSSFDTSKVTNMKQMFYMCSKLTELDLSSFNTTNVTNMGQMFHYCVGLTELDLSNFDTSKVTNMTVIFNNCSSLTELDLSSFDTSNITSMGSMFYNCSSLTELDLSGWNTSNVTSMFSMFYNCTSLTELDLSGWNTINVTEMSSMFSNCNYLKTIWVGNLWSVANVTNSSSMFSDCYLLVGGEGTKFSSSYIDKTYARVDGGLSNPGYLTLSTPATLMSGSAFNLKIPSNCTEVIFDRYGLYTSKFYWLSGESVSVDASGNTTAEIKTFKDGTKLYVLSKGKIYGNSDCSYMFYKATEILSITFNNFNTSNVTNMSNMFEIGYTYYPSAYSGSEYVPGKLENIVGLHRFNTSNVTDMSGMFYWCSKLTELDLSSFNTSNVTNMGALFFNCNNLKKLDVTNFNTSNVTTMGGMFFNCYNLTKLDVTNFNTSNVTVMALMFMGCDGLTKLDLSSFNTAKVTAMNYMFQFCENLKTIYVGDDWTTHSVEISDLMFAGCTSLVGGEGTTINSSYVDKTYARVDGGPSNPGYFTAK